MARLSKSRDFEALQSHLKAHGTPSFHLGGPRRGQILEASRQARLEAPSGLRNGFQGLQAVSLTAAVVAFLILSAGFLAQMPGMGHQVPPVFTGSQAQPSEIWADYQDGQVIISLKGDSRRPFSVRQGREVTQARAAAPVRVEGPAFVQAAQPEAHGAVFYVVE